MILVPGAGQQFDLEGRTYHELLRLTVGSTQESIHAKATFPWRVRQLMVRRWRHASAVAVLLWAGYSQEVRGGVPVDDQC